MNSPATPAQRNFGSDSGPIFPWREVTALFLVGVSLAIAQFLMVRDFVTILYGEEVVIVLVSTTFFLGLSLGYRWSLKLSQRAFMGLLGLSLLLHLTFPHSYRFLAAGIARWGGEGFAFLGLLFVYAVAFNATFATFLPRAIHPQEGQEGEPGEGEGSNPGGGAWVTRRLKRAYSAELLGFAVGFALISLTWNRPLTWLLPIYWLGLGGLVHLVFRRGVVTLIYGGLALLAVVLLPYLDPLGSALIYEYKHNIPGAKVLYSVNSPYQKVEVVENAKGERLLYLDGLLNLNASDLDDLNHYLAVLPAKLIQPRRALIIGNGTLSSAPRLHPHTRELLSVELDTGVLKAGKAFFTPPQALEKLDHWRLQVDDGKHFLSQSREMFDLIVMDIPSPLTVQEGVLHTKEFYRLARERMPMTGVIAVQISGILTKNDRIPARIVAALRSEFEEVMVVNSKKADRGFAYAARRLPFTVPQVRAGQVVDESRLEVIPPTEIDPFLTEAHPFSLDRLDLVAVRGVERFLGRYF
ncbi:MAG: hypothetical protein HQL52_15970 [Magnetococcales bacterium]|nr:hypothetical protein [Magnetococcales bacterium]